MLPWFFSFYRVVEKARCWRVWWAEIFYPVGPVSSPAGLSSCSWCMWTQRTAEKRVKRTVHICPLHSNTLSFLCLLCVYKWTECVSSYCLSLVRVVGFRSGLVNSNLSQQKNCPALCFHSAVFSCPHNIRMFSETLLCCISLMWPLRPLYNLSKTKNM